MPAEVRRYDRLFVKAHPEAGGKDFIENLNPNSLKVLNAFVEPSLAAAKADDKFEFAASVLCGGSGGSRRWEAGV